MKILIADDMEGVTGVVDWDHVDSQKPEYNRYRKLLTEDVNAAIRGAFNAGADEVVVTDGHGSGRNVLIEDLDGRARLNHGSPSPLSMVQGIDNHVDAVFFVGYHARAGTLNATLCHTWTGMIINVWLDKLLVGEIGFNAAICGHFNVPVLMIAGCQAACDEAASHIPGIETAPVKKATGRYTAECLSPESSHKLIEGAAERAVRRFKEGNGTKPFKVPAPLKVKVEYSNPGQVDNVALMPGVVRLDGRTVEFAANDLPSAFSAFRAAASLSR